MRNVKLLCTLGPKVFNEKSIKRLSELGVDLFRINLSHTKTEEIESRVNLIRSYSEVPICLDSEGAQVRTGDFASDSFFVEEQSIITVHKEEILGGSHHFNFYPLNIFDQLRVGDLISIDFNAVLTQVIKINSFEAKIRVLNEGIIGKNKAVNLDRIIEMPPLTRKDIESLEIGKKLNIKHVALSFAGHAEDVREIKKYCHDDTYIISKVESRKALLNLDGIIGESNAVLIDRGDLSREVDMEYVPFWQKKIINRTKQLGKEVFVATNLLESMVVTPYPTRAEVNDIYNTLVDGADGVVLAAETAIGAYPLECASMVKKIIAVVNSEGNEESINNPIYAVLRMRLKLMPPEGLTRTLQNLS